MYQWYLLYSLGIRRNDLLYRAYIGIAHRGPTLGSGYIGAYPLNQGDESKGNGPEVGLHNGEETGNQGV